MLNKAVIDLRAIEYNARVIKRRLPKGVKFCAVVKADGYGHGGSEVANAVYKTVDCYAVALIEEAVALRLSGIDKEILVLTKFYKCDLESAVRYGLTLTVSRLSEISEIEKECVRQGKTLGVHIKYNTGMNRQGVDSIAELNKILRRIDKSERVRLEGIYSHYNFPENGNSRKRATEKFLLAIKAVKVYNNKVVCHISSSGGFLFSEYFDMVRIGILLYGYTPFKTDKIKVKPALKVFAPVVKRRKLNNGESCLYGNLKVNGKKDATLIRFGYADGLPRESVDGQINNRCMDITALNKKAYGRINIIKDLNSLSEKYRTIPYEILTKCTVRAERIYKR